MDKEKTKKTNVNKLFNSFECCTQFYIECFVCGRTEEDVYMDDKLVETYYNNGWRYATSNKYNTEGPMCPECAAKTDAKR